MLCAHCGPGQEHVRKGADRIGFSAVVAGSVVPGAHVPMYQIAKVHALTYEGSARLQNPRVLQVRCKCVPCYSVPCCVVLRCVALRRVELTVVMFCFWQAVASTCAQSHAPTMTHLKPEAHAGKRLQLQPSQGSW